jgi:protein-L-isoaspartate(D-aspartate) O-methyltransferase
MATEPAAINAGLATPAIATRTPALATGQSLAYFTHRRLPDQPDGTRSWELGAIGHGPDGTDLAKRICSQIRVWAVKRTAQPLITAYRVDSDAPPPLPGSMVIRKPAAALTIAY